MSKTPVSAVVSLTGTSGQETLGIDFSASDAGMLFAATTVSGATGNWEIGLQLVPIDPTTQEPVSTGSSGILSGPNLSGNAGGSSVDLAQALTGVYAASYNLSWNLLGSGLASLSDQQVTLTFVPAPGEVTVTITE